MKISRLRKLIFLHLQNLPMKSRGWRPQIAKMGGVSVLAPARTFIGSGVVFDTNYPEDIIIEEGVRITTRCILLTHFMNPEDHSYSRGKIIIRRGAYIGCGTIICKPVEIGEKAVVGAGSIVTRNIPSGEVWAGNPARFIRKA